MQQVKVPENAYAETEIYGERDIDYVVVNDDDELLTPIYIQLPKRPGKAKIEGARLVKGNQKFKHTEFPNDLRRIEDQYREDYFGYKDAVYKSVESVEFIKEEFRRFKEGYWFFNNGAPTYITGLHYFYLNYWRNSQNGGRIFYRWADRQMFIAWDWVYQSQYHEGLMYLTKRRSGKSEIAKAMLYFNSATKPYFKSGLQSKTEKDAAKLFGEIIATWRKFMPMFLKPLYANDNDNPSNDLFFSKPRQKRGKENKYENFKTLESTIFHVPSNEMAFDGRELNLINVDEFSKSERVDIIKRHEVTRLCLRNQLRELVGKTYYTSTIEMLDKEAGQAARKIFDQSDLAKVKKEGWRSTESGLIPFFMPAHKATKLDDFGNPDEAESIKLIEEERSKKKGNQLAEVIRKNPLSVKEAFQGTNTDCLFNIMLLNEQIEQVNDPENQHLIQAYRMEWANGKDSEVVLVPDDEGPLLVHQLPDADNRNAFIKTESSFTTATGDQVFKKIPKNKDSGVIGIDPIDHNKKALEENNKRQSNAAACVYQLFNPLIDKHEYAKVGTDFWDERYVQENQKTGKFTMVYKNRPEDASEFYEDMIKLCAFTGYKMLFETQKPGISTHFKNRGYEEFMMMRPKSTVDTKWGTPNTYGVPGSDKVFQVAFTKANTYVDTQAYKIWFYDILEDFRDIDFKDRTKYDVGVAALLTLLAADNITFKPKTEVSIPTNVKFFQLYGS